MEMKMVIEGASRQLAEMTGLRPEAVTRAFQDEQGWHIGIELLEMSRVPSSTDLLGDYEVVVAESGTLLRFERKHRRIRAETRNGERE